ncbi:MAG: UDP-N-acetylglucosamine 2-epimerase (non-hydrolyzing) [Bacteroidota bacterium]
MLNVLCIAGTRPNFIKVSALYHAFTQHPRLSPTLVHTGQHYDAQMSRVFFEQLGLPEPDLYLGVGSGTHGAQTAAIMQALEAHLIERPPDVVVVVGDVNSTVAATLAAVKLHLPVAHVEAGLRSFDRRMPEEINRLITDAISDVLYVSEESGLTNLRREGIPDERVVFVGNVMIDSLIRFQAHARGLDTAQAMFGLAARSYLLVTLHRPSNVDVPERLLDIADVLETIQARIPVVFPVHPRTRQRLESQGLYNKLDALPRLHLAPPIGYLEFLSLMHDARGMLTDSGGTQEETTFLGVPCLTLRDNTERPVTVTQGTNTLLALDKARILHHIDDIIASEPTSAAPPPLWDGQSAVRIADDLARRYAAAP